MKSVLMLFLLALTYSVRAEIKTVKYEQGLSQKFSDQNWQYQYIKELRSITPHIFENKKDKELKVVVQKETHQESHYKKQSLVSDKCAAANKFYKESMQGSAQNMKIKGQDVCLIKMVKKDKNSYQIIYPVHFAKGSYDLISFAWYGDEGKLEAVKELVGENL